MRRILGTRRVGHGGTLDPFATGLLPILVGRATRLMPYLVGLSKAYTGTLRLGDTTTTDDCTGEPVRTRDWSTITEARLRDAFASHVGRRPQRPPVFSAKKVHGERAHRRARRGQPVELAARTVDIHQLEMTGRRGAEVDFHTLVGSGTYVRALARDLGEALECGAHLVRLRRQAVGPWTVADAVTLERLEGGFAAPRPVADAVPHLPVRPLDTDERAAVRHGRPLASHRAWDAPAVALMADHTLVAIAEPHGDLLRPRVVLED